MNILRYRKWLYLFSLILLAGGVAATMVYGIPLGVDFTGGTIVEITNIKLQITNDEERKQVGDLVYTSTGERGTVQRAGMGQWLIKSSPLPEGKVEDLRRALSDQGFQVSRITTVGPVVSRALTERALLALVLAALLIIGYLAYAFRGVAGTISSWRFGLTAIIAMLHDVAVVLGIFALLRAFKGPTFEVNSEFIAAMLTVIGFSIHDTIVVFDRIRENLLKGKLQMGAGIGEYLEAVSNTSLNQTLIRSFNTSLTTLLALFALLLFGGPSVRGFATALFTGILTGTYSSIFVAAPLLVDWQYWRERREKR